MEETENLFPFCLVIFASFLVAKASQRICKMTQTAMRERGNCTTATAGITLSRPTVYIHWKLRRMLMTLGMRSGIEKPNNTRDYLTGHLSCKLLVVVQLLLNPSKHRFERSLCFFNMSSRAMYSPEHVPRGTYGKSDPQRVGGSPPALHCLDCVFCFFLKYCEVFTNRSVHPCSITSYESSPRPSVYAPLSIHVPTYVSRFEFPRIDWILLIDDIHSPVCRFIWVLTEGESRRPQAIPTDGSEESGGCDRSCNLEESMYRPILTFSFSVYRPEREEQTPCVPASAN